jgi:hypothetical protein
VCSSSLSLELVSAGASASTLALAVRVALAYRRDRRAGQRLRDALVDDVAELERLTAETRAPAAGARASGRSSGRHPWGSP